MNFWFKAERTEAMVPVNIVINLTDGEKEYYLREDDKNVIYNKMSSYQRAKIESFFGKMNAYYTKIEIL